MIYASKKVFILGLAHYKQGKKVLSILL